MGRGWGHHEGALPALLYRLHAPACHYAASLQRPAEMLKTHWSSGNSAVVSAAVLVHDNVCLQDGIDRGWFRTNRSAIHGLPDIMPILATAREVASGMAHLHSMNILHGDLTSLNVLLTSSDIDNRGFIAKVSRCMCVFLSV